MFSELQKETSDIKYVDSHKVNINNVLFYLWVPVQINLVKNNFIFIFISLYSDSIEVDPSDNSKKIEIKVDLVSTLLASRYIFSSSFINNPGIFYINRLKTFV